MVAIKYLRLELTSLLMTRNLLDPVHWLASISSQFIKSQAVFTKLCLREVIFKKLSEMRLILDQL